MKPIKSRELFKEVSNITDQNEDLVRSLIESFYIKVRATLSSLEFTRIFIQDLGTFYIKERMMTREKAKCQRIKEYYKNKPQGIRAQAILDNVNSQLSCIANLEQIIEKRNQDRKFLKLYRKNYYESKGKIEGPMEGEIQDNRGSL